MASTYSSRLRIELIGTGDQSGTWGDTTNTNLGTLIDEAVAGVAAVTMTDANYTLTVSNGATDQSRKAVTVLSGTLSTTRNVVCPTSQKVYIVKNATSGGQSIVFKTSAGSGVTIANGDTVTVYCDGTNVVLGSVPFISPTLTGSISLDGAVVVNDSGADKDFRVEGDTDTNLIFADASTDRVGFGTATPSSKFDLNGAMMQNSVAIPASNIDCTAGNFFSKTISGTTTFTVSNVPTTGTASSLVLALTNGGSSTINWWSGVKWASGSAPTLTTSGKDILGFYTTDGGTNWNGFMIAKDVR